MSFRLELHPAERLELECRPGFEGSNIGTSVGFKQVMYLAEEAALQFLRERGVVAGSLYARYGLCLEIVDSDLRVLQALDMDDVVRIHVRSQTDAGDRELRLLVEMLTGRGGQLVKAASGEVRVLFREAQRSGAACPPPELVPFIRQELRRPPAAGPGLSQGRGVAHPSDVAGQIVPAGLNAFVWRWRVPSFYCHFTERIQHSGYVRILEEVVDLFLADRGISIQTLLRSRAWAPAVAGARIEILRDAFMEETLYTVYSVEQIVERTRCIARMDCYVPRDGGLVHSATGRLTHGFLQVDARGIAGGPVRFDGAVMAALSGSGR